MAGVTTMQRVYWPLMHLDPKVAEAIANSDRCVVCGRAYPLNRHHIVPRSAGELYEDGRKVEKRLIVLCGFGSNLSDADGRLYCHGRAHHRMLHFRNDRGRLEFLELERPTDYLTALDCDGWEAIGGRIWRF